MHGGNPKSHEDAAEYEGKRRCVLTIDEIKPAPVTKIATTSEAWSMPMS